MIQDLPTADQPVSLVLISRKWFCDSPACPVKVFTERYDWLAPHGRRTLRAEHTLRQIAFSTSCLSAQKVAQSIHLPVSHDTLLTLIRTTPYSRRGVSLSSESMILLFEKDIHMEPPFST
ncbi:hypothetical protein [Parageobacillus toebii]|uniref:hypothetical protein n=1 Tax=Parageobacillus toebii TaxID=153151 RepID=UPI0028169412|nr:hypothetical protein [Parageobacillus toebii]WMT20643.1 hypothetical protein RFB12_04440 [Parageobacillus toebii]